MNEYDDAAAAASEVSDTGETTIDENSVELRGGEVEDICETGLLLKVVLASLPSRGGVP